MNDLNGAGWLNMSETQRAMYRKTVAHELDKIDENDWRDRPLHGSGFLFAAALGILIYALALWAWGVL